VVPPVVCPTAVYPRVYTRVYTRVTLGYISEVTLGYIPEVILRHTPGVTLALSSILLSLSIIIQIPKKNSKTIHPHISRISPENTFLMTKQINFSFPHQFPSFFSFTLACQLFISSFLFFSLKWKWME